MFRRKKKEALDKIRDLVREGFTDFDIIREKPMVFTIGKYCLVVAPVLWSKHRMFLQDMGNMILRYSEIFSGIDFLSAHSYKDESLIKIIVDKISIYTGTRKYKRFQKDTIRFIHRWAQGTFLLRSSGGQIVDVIPVKPKEVTDKFQPDEIIHILFTLFVFNFDVVKKKTFGFIKMLTGTIQQGKGTSTTGSRKKTTRMPKYQDSPYKKSLLLAFERQSKGNTGLTN